jgi:hypothetical protein
MRNGKYAIDFSAGDFDGSGWLSAEDNQVQGGDTTYRLKGEIVTASDRAEGQFNVVMEQALTLNSQMPLTFSFSAVGTTSDAEFSLIGVGPLGMIIELSGIRKLD